MVSKEHVSTASKQEFLHMEHPSVFWRPRLPLIPMEHPSTPPSPCTAWPIIAPTAHRVSQCPPEPTMASCNKSAPPQMVPLGRNIWTPKHVYCILFTEGGLLRLAEFWVLPVNRGISTEARWHDQVIQIGSQTIHNWKIQLLMTRWSIQTPWHTTIW